MHITSYATTAQSRFQLVVKSNTVSLRHEHSSETLIIHNNPVYTQSILHLKYCFQQNFIFKNLIFENLIFRKFYQNLFDFILFYFILINFFFRKIYFYNEQCSFSDSGKIPSQTGSKQVECTKCTTYWPSCTPRPCPGHPAGGTPRTCCAPRACLLRACAARLQRVPACRAPAQRPPTARPPALPVPVRPLTLRPRAHAACAVPRALCLAQRPAQP